MGQCRVCSNPVKSKSPSLRCVQCSNLYHPNCVSVPSENVRYLSVSGVSWRCPSCRAAAPVINSDDDADIVTTDASKIDEILKSIRSMVTDIKQLKSDYSDILKSIKFCSHKIRDLEFALKSANEKIKVIDKLVLENHQLKDDITAACVRIDELEQYSRLNNLEIQAVPEVANENLVSVLEAIAAFVKCPITADDLDVVHRVPSFADKSKQQHKNIIVTFTSRRKRDQFLSAAKLYRKESKSPDINVPNVSPCLFINEHLTRDRKSLFQKTKLAVRQKNVKYVCVRNGAIFARKYERSRVVAIKSEKDLDKIN
ncbi:l1 transposable element-related [Holotrichia oblita]|uniref:L1 transposable element-related n=1 Tax=Holotrichia oblita TaxID=644536 RepID=A0ACB9SXQ7_HOLOL|nr:l1 transposable element-related [Holotrichia oblita]